MKKKHGITAELFVVFYYNNTPIDDIVQPLTIVIHLLLFIFLQCFKVLVFLQVAACPPNVDKIEENFLPVMY